MAAESIFWRLRRDSSLILIELKRGRSPREVVAQAIDYATWVEALDGEAVARIYSRFKKGADLARDFEARFGVGLDVREPSSSKVPGPSHGGVVSRDFVGERLSDAVDLIVMPRLGEREQFSLELR